MLLILIIALLGVFYFTKEKTDTDVRRYEVVMPDKDDDYIELKVLDKIDVSNLLSVLLKQEKNGVDEPINFIQKYTEGKHIINILKDYDASFKDVNYKYSYNFLTEDKTNCTIFITYYINNNIGTNKVYLVSVENNEVKSITVAGVTKSNIENINSVDNNTLINLANEFTGEVKKNAILAEHADYFKSEDILNKDNTIKVDSIEGKVTKHEEIFYYDYNTKIFEYDLKICYDYGHVYDCSAIEIKLN